MGPLATLAAGIDLADANAGVVGVAGAVIGVLVLMLGLRKVVKTVNRT